jgi:hypothetical protein
MKDLGQHPVQEHRVNAEEAVSLLVDHAGQVDDQRPGVTAATEVSAAER